MINPYFGTEETILAAEIDVAELRSVEKTIPAASSVPVSEALSFSASASGGQVPKSPTDTFKEMLEHHLWPEFKEFVRQSIRGQCRQVLAYHTTTACQPGKKEGVQGSLIDCGLEAHAAHVRMRLRICMRSRMRVRIHARKHKSARAFLGVHARARAHARPHALIADIVAWQSAPPQFWQRCRALPITI